MSTNVTSAVDKIIKLAIVVGEGDLPNYVIESVKKKNIPYVVITFDGIKSRVITKRSSIFRASFENISSLFERLLYEKIDSVVFCGAMRRPKLNFLSMDLDSQKILSPILESFKKGDDSLFRAIISVFEARGIRTVSLGDLLPSLTQKEGFLTTHKPSEMDIYDAKSAEKLWENIGSIDVGQGLIVAKGLCIAIETLPGTDAMLDFVKKNNRLFKDTDSKRNGILYKAPKIDQTNLVDLPAIGPETIVGVDKARLSGIVIRDRGVLIIDKKKTISLANQQGIFVWSRKGGS
jgi:Uncharacterized protein conserved in bacteria